MAYHFCNLVLEGGGVKGIAYVGALQVLEEKGILSKIQRVGGTSAMNSAGTKAIFSVNGFRI
jgi:NTE family protein